MKSTQSMSKLVSTLSPRATTPDLTPLGLEDAPAWPLAVPSSPQEPAVQLPVRPPTRLAPQPPSRPAPLPPPIVAPSALRRQALPLLDTALPAHCPPMALVGRAHTEPTPKLAPASPVAPLRTVSASHKWLAHYLLGGPAAWGLDQLLAEDMLGAGILKASATGALPLVKEHAAATHRPLNEFKAFVEGVSDWSQKAPKGCEAQYRVGAMRFGAARMAYSRTVDLQCLDLETVPPEVAQMPQVHTLLLRGNNLRRLPSSWSTLRHLRLVDLRNNPLEYAPWIKCDVLLVDDGVLPAPVRADGRF